MSMAIAAPADGGGTQAAQPDRWQLRVRTAILCLLVLSVQLLTPLPYYFKLWKSMAPGMVVAAGICIVVMAASWVIATRRWRMGLLDAGGGGLALVGGVLILVIIHGLVADQIQRIETGRFVASLAPLAIMLAGGLALSLALRTATASQIETLTWASFWLMCAIIALRLAHLEPLGRVDKATFPFDETSHFALALGPIFLYRCASSRRRLSRDLWLLLGLAFAVGLQSATFIPVVLIAAFICRRLLIIALIGAALLAVGLSVELKYFTSRADISSGNKNLSAVVYLEGWEMLGESLEQTDGWGVGFQQLGVHGTDVAAAETVADLTGGGELNTEDGSFVMSKLGSEFGVAGLMVVLAFGVLAFRAARSLRAGRGPPALSFAHCVVAAYSVDMFVRGTGYFSESALLFFGALLVLAPEGGLLRAGRGLKLQHLVSIR